MKLRTLALFAALLAATPGLHAQTPTVRIETRSEVTIKVLPNGNTLVVIGGSDVGPAPTPVPGPVDPEPAPLPPPPAPQPIATGKLWVTLIYSEKAETQKQAQARANLALSKEWGGLDADFDAYESSQKVVSDRGFSRLLKATPTLFVQEQKSGDTAPVLKTIESVDDAASVLAAVKALRGKP